MKFSRLFFGSGAAFFWQRRGFFLVAARLGALVSAGRSPTALLAAAVAFAAPRSDFDEVLSITCAGYPCQKYLWGTLGAQVIDTKQWHPSQT